MLHWSMKTPRMNGDNTVPMPTQDVVSTDRNWLQPIPVVEGVPALRAELAGHEVISLADFTDAERKTIAQISASVSLADTVSTEFFAAPPLKKLSDQLDRTLQGVRTDELGDKGANIVIGIRKQFDTLRLDKVKQEIANGESLLARLPLVGGWFSAFQYMRANHAKVAEHLEALKQESEILLGKLKGVLVTSDRQYEATAQAIDEFALWLAGGQQAWLRLRDEYRATLTNIEGTTDMRRLATMRDTAEALDSFATTLVELRIAHLGFIADLPQIRMAQKAARIEVQNTLRSIFLDLPRIKNAMRTMASLRQLSKASATSKVRKGMSQDLARLSAELSGAAYQQALASEGDFDSDVATANYVMDTVVGAIDKGLETREANADKRDAAIKSLDESYARFVNSLRASAQRGLAR